MNNLIQQNFRYGPADDFSTNKRVKRTSILKVVALLRKVVKIKFLELFLGVDENLARGLPYFDAGMLQLVDGKSRNQ